MRRLFKILAVSVLAGLVATPAAAGVLKNEIIMICTFEDEIRTLKWKDVIFSKNTILEWADIDTRRPIKDPPLWVEWCPALQPSLGKPVEPILNLWDVAERSIGDKNGICKTVVETVREKEHGGGGNDHLVGAYFEDDEASDRALTQDGGEIDFPKLGATPDTPRQASSPEDLDQLTGGLVADRDEARYTNETLRSRYADDDREGEERQMASPASAVEPVRKQVHEAAIPKGTRYQWALTRYIDFESLTHRVEHEATLLNGERIGGHVVKWECKKEEE